MVAFFFVKKSDHISASVGLTVTVLAWMNVFVRGRSQQVVYNGHLQPCSVGCHNCHKAPF